MSLAVAAQRLANADFVAALTGAGVSAESGVPTFRGAGGLWRGFRAEELASLAGFARHPEKIWEWYNWRRQVLAEVEPNPAHFALARLEDRLGGRFGLATQNVDRLHQKAGSKRVVELHGTIWETLCTGCGARVDDRRVLANAPRCAPCGAPLRPGVVWFGEPLPADGLAQAYEWARTGDVFLLIGTSAVVYPAIDVAHEARRHGRFVIEINPEETPLTRAVDLSLRGKAGELLPRIIP